MHYSFLDARNWLGLRGLRVHKGGRIFEAMTLLGTDSRRGYFSKDFHHKIALSFLDTFSLFHFLASGLIRFVG